MSKHRIVSEMPFDADGHCWITLQQGETAENPDSTKRVIDGPARIEYTRYPDGGVHAQMYSLQADEE